MPLNPAFSQRKYGLPAQTQERPGSTAWVQLTFSGARTFLSDILVRLGIDPPPGADKNVALQLLDRFSSRKT
jgi:hypothetical protein